ncbi:hypothetical protein N665_0894s0001 [Sinapis alba]|nr:hypothetical protein N665_0894s0001 [Sinapis alba]
MKISQDPIKGAYQSSDVFWSRVMKGYGNKRKTTWCERTKGSQHKKLHACIRQCKNRRPSRASDKMIFENPKFKTGWKFDYVWNIIKNFEKFMDGSTSPNDHVINSLTQVSLSLSSFSPNLDDDDEIISGSSSQRPSGLKKTSGERIHHMEIQKQNHTLKEENKVLLCDLSSIQGPNVCAYIQAQQVQII